MATASRTEISPSPAGEVPPTSGAEPAAPSGAGRVSAAALEQRTQQVGRELFARIGRGPGPWHRAWWDDRFMAATLDDPLVRVQLFRFIDALPALKDSETVRRHLVEYLDEAGEAVPWWLNVALGLAPAGSTRAAWLAEVARAAAGFMARKFIAGATPEEALQTVRTLRHRR